jgi:flagellar biogenesis protein FliO
MKTTLRTLALAAAGIPFIVWGQAASLTGKSSPIPTPAPTSPALIDFWGLAQLAVALGIVAALLKWGLPWVMKRMKSDSSAKGSIQVMESVSLGAAQLQLVKALDRTLLIGVTTQSTRLIADLSATSPTSMAEAMAEPIEAKTASPVPQARPTSKIDIKIDEDDRAFFEMVDDAMEEEPIIVPQPKKTRKAPAKAVISRPVIQETTEEEEDMSFQQALALIQAAKKRSGLEEQEPLPAKPKTRLPDPAKVNRSPRPVKSLVEAAGYGAPATPAELSDREIQEALERIKRLSR